MQERIESSWVGRSVISAFLLLTLFVLVTQNLPNSELKRISERLDRPYIDATGLDQNWGVFAPNPRRQAFELRARITYVDGSTEIWEPPSGDPLVGAYRTVRWRKWVEAFIRDDLGRFIWRPAAEWVAREQADPARRPVRVTLVRRWYDLLPPGDPRGERLGWRQEEFFVLDLEAGAPGGTG